MTGPCLCGDPYCGSCGNPGAAQYEAFIERLDEQLSEYSEDECRIFVAAGTAAVVELRKCEAERKAEYEAERKMEEEYEHDHP